MNTINKRLLSSCGKIMVDEVPEKDAPIGMGKQDRGALDLVGEVPVSRVSTGKEKFH